LGESYIFGARFLSENVVYVFVGYSLTPMFCAFHYCHFKIYTGLFISDEDKRMSMMKLTYCGHDCIREVIFVLS